MLRILATLALSGVTLGAMAEDYTIDSNHTFPHFEIKHLGLSTFRGRFDKTSGTITLDTAKKKGSVEVTIDVNSVSTGVEALNDHLRKADFFDVEKYPTITFKSTEFTFADEELIEVAGTLTMHGVSKPISLQVNSFICTVHPMSKKPVCGADMETTIRRGDFGITYGSPNLGDEVTIRINVEANQKTAAAPAPADAPAGKAGKTGKTK